MTLQFVGNTSEVLRLFKEGASNTTTLFPGGAQAGILQAGAEAVIEKVCPNLNNRTLVGNSVGSVNALLAATRQARNLVPLWPSQFCNQLVKKTFGAWRKGSVIDCDYLQTRLTEAIPGEHLQERLIVGQTDYWSGAHHMRDCTGESVETAIGRVVASCRMPGVTSGLTESRIGTVSDGSIGNPLPVKALLKHDDFSALLIVMPGRQLNEEELRRSYMYQALALVAMHPRMPKGLRQTLFAAADSYCKNMQWLQEQVEIPLGSPSRELPPTCLVYTNVQVGPLENRRLALSGALRQTVRSWHRAFKGV